MAMISSGTGSVISTAKFPAQRASNSQHAPELLTRFSEQALGRAMQSLATDFEWFDNSPAARLAARTLRICAGAKLQKRHFDDIEANTLTNEIARHAALPGAISSGRAFAPLIASGALGWKCSGMVDGRIPRSVAAQMLTCELVGPNGLFYRDNIRIGLFAQSPDVAYPVREHAAQENFLMLAGKARWYTHQEGWYDSRAGSAIRHASFEPHASASTSQPFLAAWVWTGDLSFDSYLCADPDE